MEILFLVVLLTIIFAFLSQNTKNFTNVFVLAAIVAVALFIGLRTGYNDTANYIRSFNNAMPLSDFLLDSDRMHLLHNPLFYGIESWFSGITDNYHIFFMIFAVIDSALMISFIKRNSFGYFGYAILLFWGYGLGVFGLAAMKQFTAMALLTIAITAAADKKWLKFIVIVIIAGLIHTYAFMFFVLPLFTSKPWNQKTLLIIAVTSIVMATFNTSIASILDYADSLGKSVADFEVFDGVQMNVYRVMVFAIVPVMLLAFRRRLVHQMDRIQCLLANMSIISFMFMCLGTVNGANMFGRLATYFVLGNICLLGWILEQVFDFRSKQMLMILSFVMFIYFIYYDNIDFATTGGYSTISLWEFFRGVI